MTDDVFFAALLVVMLACFVIVAYVAILSTAALWSESKLDPPLREFTGRIATAAQVAVVAFMWLIAAVALVAAGAIWLSWPAS